MGDLPSSMSEVLKHIRSYNLKSRDDRLNNHCKFVDMIANIPFPLLDQLKQEVSRDGSAYAGYMNGYDVTTVLITHRNRSKEYSPTEKDKPE